MIVAIGGRSAPFSGCCAAGGQFYRMTPHSYACARFCLAGGGLGYLAIKKPLLWRLCGCS
ncbi:hypothetical protein ACEF99_000239 [Salmonella enterica subsp. enterica serovar Newport]